MLVIVIKSRLSGLKDSMPSQEPQRENRFKAKNTRTQIDNQGKKSYENADEITTKHKR